MSPHAAGDVTSLSSASVDAVEATAREALQAVMEEHHIDGDPHIASLREAIGTHYAHVAQVLTPVVGIFMW